MTTDDVVMLLWAMARLTPCITTDLAVLQHARALAHRSLQSEIMAEAAVPLVTALILLDTVAGAVGDDHPWTMEQFDALVGALEG